VLDYMSSHIITDEIQARRRGALALPL